MDTRRSADHRNVAASQARIAFFRAGPNPYSPKAPVLRRTRWQGMRNATGFLATALPTARTAFRAPIREAISS